MNLKSSEQLASTRQRFINYLKQFRDIRVLGLHVFAIIALLVTWSGLGIIQRNYQLQQQISRLQQENELRQLENETLRLRNEYFNTDQYLELTARQQFGRAAPGEKLLLIPRSVALKHTVSPPPQQVIKQVSSTEEKPSYQRNFEAWIEFLFRRAANR